MTTYGFENGSFIRKPAAIIRTERNQLFQSVFGEDLNIASTSPEGNLIGAESEREALIQEIIEAVFYSQWIDTASGASLDNAVAYLGLGRIAARRATTSLTLATIEALDVDIETGTQAKQSSTAVIWETLSDVTIPAATNVIQETITDIEYQSGNTIRYTFDTTISGATVGDVLYMTGATFSTNNNLFSVSAVGSDYVDVENLNRSDDTADELSVSLDGVITDGYITVDAQTVDAGLFTASQNTINTINNPITGWDYVGNMAVASEGRAVETDTELRTRARENKNSATGGTLSSIKARLLEIDGVTYASGRENRTASIDANSLPPHSFEFVILGGDNQDIADTLYQIKGAGIETYGSVGVSVVDDFGVSNTMYFSRPTEVDIYLIVNVTHDSDYPADGDTQIQTALVTYGATLRNGDDVLNYKLIDAIAAIPGLLTIEILQGLSDPPTLTANLSIAETEVASITADDIAVNS